MKLKRSKVIKSNSKILITSCLARPNHLSFPDGQSDRLGQDSSVKEFLTRQQLRFKSRLTYKNRDLKRNLVFRKS